MIAIRDSTFVSADIDSYGFDRVAFTSPGGPQVLLPHTPGVLDGEAIPDLVSFICLKMQLLIKLVESTACALLHPMSLCTWKLPTSPGEEEADVV